jgi:hypothetical protein
MFLKPARSEKLDTREINWDCNHNYFATVSGLPVIFFGGAATALPAFKVSAQKGLF